MKKRIVTVTVMVVIFLTAIVIFSSILNRGTDDTTADIGGATLPVISFEEENYTINALPGYTESMDITAMRDVVYPLSVGTSVKANITGYPGKIHSATYEVCTLDGRESIKKEVIKNVKDALNIELGNTISDGKEKVLKIKLTLENKKDVYYYTRVVRGTDFNVHPCLTFAEEFHKKTFDKEEVITLKEHLTKGNSPDSLQTVTINSSIEQIGWGNLEPKIAGNVRWEIKESTETYNSIYLKYRVKCGEDLYNVTEFLKVRFLKGKASLEDYERTMNQIFSGTEKDFEKKGIALGITDENVQYLVNESGNVVSFVQEREVWTYNKEEDEISLVFSFADSESEDIRNYNDSHAIHLIDMDKSGNTTFAVYGYMNRGAHEGQVGAAIYYFNIAKNYVEEKAFIPSKQSGEMAVQKLNQHVYYSEPQNTLYVVFDGALYQVDLETEEKEILVKNLEENQYTASADGKYLAYQANGTLTEANSMMVWNLQSGESYEVKAAEDEAVRPLGFVQGDIVYGIGKKADVGKTVSGETVLPLYKLEIRNEKNKVAKTYQMDQVYVVDIQITDNMVTMNRVQKNGNAYNSIAQDYITNNKEQKKQEMKVETYVSEENGLRQVRLTDGKRIENTKPKLLKPKQILYEKPTTIAFNVTGSEESYYVYGRGKLQGVFDNAGSAIAAADSAKGVVSTSKQTKIWERGNRQLRYSLDGASAFAVNEGENSLTACLRQMIAYTGKNVDVAGEMANGKSVVEILNTHSGGEALDLTGCTIEELFYIIGKGTPVIAMTGGDSAILLVGYDNTTVTYINPETGKKPTESIEAVEKMVKGGHGILIGYAK